MGKLARSSAFDVRRVTIAAGAATTTLQQSGPVDLEGYPLLGFIFSSGGWGGATQMSFLAGTGTGGVFEEVFDDDAAEVTINVAAGRAVALTGAEADALVPWRIMKFRRGTATNLATATTSAAFTLVLKT